MIYLDSCALVKLVLSEKETAALDRFLSQRRSEMITSELALTEVIRVVRRSCYSDQRELTVDSTVLHDRLALTADLLDRVDLIAVNRDRLIKAATFTNDPFVGTLDAIHLVSAQLIQTALKAFITYDKALSRAATQAGLPVVQPT
ncbi:type II toxin-antitoxin system VapC family toxin [Nonomuraea sp. NPDC049152]|uniref:type II toxin-antitoxin system VapC family toxin n=1 Tax=Nonomuraea sp. NPDC049152 TaxID=3154350 RepID=UPI0034061939